MKRTENVRLPLEVLSITQPYRNVNYISFSKKSPFTPLWAQLVQVAC